MGRKKGQPRANKTITLSLQQMAHVDAHFQGNFSRYVSGLIEAHMNGSILAKDMTTTRLLGMVMGRLDKVKAHTFDNGQHTKDMAVSLMQLIKDLDAITLGRLNDPKH